MGCSFIFGLEYGKLSRRDTRSYAIFAAQKGFYLGFKRLFRFIFHGPTVLKCVEGHLALVC